MALRVGDENQPGRTQPWGELDLVLDLMMSDYLTATVAGGITPVATECPAAARSRKLSSAHTLADDGSQLFFVHKAHSFRIREGPSCPTDPSCGLALHNTYF
jgi:hypothetical protein